MLSVIIRLHILLLKRCLNSGPMTFRSKDDSLNNYIQPTVHLPVAVLRERGSGPRTSLLRSHLKYTEYSTTKHKDWFDDQDAEARALLDLMHRTHLAWINDKNSSTNNAAYARDQATGHEGSMVESQVCWAASSCRSSWSECLLPNSEDLGKRVPFQYCLSTAACSQITSRYGNVGLNISRRYWTSTQPLTPPSWMNYLNGQQHFSIM